MSEQKKHTPFQQAVIEAYRHGRLDRKDGWHRDNAHLDKLVEEYATKYPCENAAQDLFIACEEAAEIIKTARQYFPKSIRNRDSFALENTNATITTAIFHAKKEGISNE